MQLSKFTDYSVRVLIYLATLKDEELTCISEVSELYQISRNHLVKVVYKLGQIGLIETVRGKNGGVRLNARPESLRIGELVRMLEPLDLLDCSPKACKISALCRLSGYLMDAKEKFIQELDQYTLQDLICGCDELPVFFEKRRQEIAASH
ncbi:MAG: Rrf2 family transcriptional regulator [Saezia sp.]